MYVYVSAILHVCVSVILCLCVSVFLCKYTCVYVSRSKAAMQLEDGGSQWPFSLAGHGGHYYNSPC